MGKIYTFVLFFSIIGSTTAQLSTELISERTAYTQTFEKANGTREQVISPSPIHYLSGNDWLPIDNTIISNGTSFVNHTNLVQTTFPQLYNGEILIKKDDAQIAISTQKDLVLYDEINGVNSVSTIVNPIQGVALGNSLAYLNVFSGMSDLYRTEAGKVKNEFILNVLPSVLANESGNYFGFKEEIKLPSNWTLQSYGAPSSELINSQLAVLNEYDEVEFIIPAPVFHEQGNETNDGVSSVMGGFVIDFNGQSWELTTLIPTDWLKIPGRSYPVVMDPTVTLAGNTGGWQSQNNYVNNPSYVFIGVCCGNMEHRAWLKYDLSSIPDNSCVTLVELQVYVNGVGASTAELVHAYDMMATTTAGIFGPYPGIMPAVYNDMGNGYYTSFTLTGTGYYGWYDLGPNAASDVMTMLSPNWYQVALIFDNEPSTNWKRLTAGNCSLRITYDAPPCLPLPIGLSEFNTSCDNDRALLTWATESESDNDYFTVWESDNGIDFNEIARVKSQGNGSTHKEYRWMNDKVDSEIKYYRLSQTDLDGTTEYFETKVYTGCSNDAPRVFVDVTKSVHIIGDNISSVFITDQMGATISNWSSESATNKVLLDGTKWSTGNYNATITYNNGLREQLKFIMMR